MSARSPRLASSIAPPRGSRDAGRLRLAPDEAIALKLPTGEKAPRGTLRSSGVAHAIEDAASSAQSKSERFQSVHNANPC